MSRPPPGPPFLCNSNLLCLKMSLGWAVPLKQNHALHFIFCFLENCSAETDRWCIRHRAFPLRYLCQLIFPLCLAVVCETVPHHSSLINGVPALRLAVAPPPALRGKNENSQLDFLQILSFKSGSAVTAHSRGKSCQSFINQEGRSSPRAPPHLRQACML